MILISAGANLATPYSTPEQTIAQIPRLLAAHDVLVISSSSLYLTAPIGMAKGTPNFINAVFLVKTNLTASELLVVLQKLEQQAGRQPARKEQLLPQSRTLDLDLLDFNQQVVKTNQLWLPHPRMHERLFVLLPLAEVESAWYHPLLNKTASELALECTNQQVTKLAVKG